MTYRDRLIADVRETGNWVSSCWRLGIPLEAVDGAMVLEPEFRNAVNDATAEYNAAAMALLDEEYTNPVARALTRKLAGND